MINNTTAELLTTEIINDLSVNGHDTEAELLRKILSDAKNNNTSAIKQIIDMSNTRWLGDLNMSTLTLKEWFDKLASLKKLWLKKQLNKRR